MDIVDCEVAPVSACCFFYQQWQFDLDAEPGGHCNIYLFVHMGVHHVLKQMLDNESDIKANVVPYMKKEKATSQITNKIISTTNKVVEFIV